MARLTSTLSSVLGGCFCAAFLAGCSGGAPESPPESGPTSPMTTASPNAESAQPNDVEPPWPEASSEVVVLPPTMLLRTLQLQKHRGKVIETTGVVEVPALFRLGRPQPILLATDEEFDWAACHSVGSAGGRFQLAA